MNLLTTSNAKTTKGEKKGYLTGILYMKPADTGGHRNLCPSASAGCKKGCLNEAGRGRFDLTQNGRQRKTDFYFNQTPEFFNTLIKDIEAVIRKAKRENLIPVFRLNGTSDAPSIARRMAKKFPDVQFYDYTKLPKPEKRVLPNYHLTFSRSEENWKDCKKALEKGINVAVVFKKLPKTYKGYKVLNGDETDLRFLDKTSKKRGYVIGLTYKKIIVDGKAVEPEEFGGFVVCD